VIATRWAVCALCLLGPLAGGAAAAGQPAPKVTIIGDSVADRIQRNPDALAALWNGFRINLQTRGCRTLVITGCTIAGQTAPPPSALQVIQRFGRYLGRIVVVEVGYNDDPTRYRPDLDIVMRALVRYRVRTVIWLTLREADTKHAPENRVIEAAPRRWPQLVIADWNAYSADHADWFLEDGIHPTPLGAANLGVFIHTVLARAVGSR
jgi:hypothetical protein